MSIEKAIACGEFGNEVSKEVVGEDVSAERTVVATGVGGAASALVGGSVTLAAAASIATAPETVPMALAGATLGAVFSIFDD